MPIAITVTLLFVATVIALNRPRTAGIILPSATLGSAIYALAFASVVLWVAVFFEPPGDARNWEILFAEVAVAWTVAAVLGTVVIAKMLRVEFSRQSRVIGGLLFIATIAVIAFTYQRTGGFGWQ